MGVVSRKTPAQLSTYVDETNRFADASTDKLLQVGKVVPETTQVPQVTQGR